MGLRQPPKYKTDRIGKQGTLYFSQTFRTFIPLLWTVLELVPNIFSLGPDFQNTFAVRGFRFSQVELKHISKERLKGYMEIGQFEKRVLTNSRNWCIQFCFRFGIVSGSDHSCPPRWWLTKGWESEFLDNIAYHSLINRLLMDHS